MKKEYIEPASYTIEYSTEGAILGMSISGDVEGPVGTSHKRQDNPIWGKQDNKTW